MADHQFYPTPDNAADRVVQAACISGLDSVLEPSAGTGALADRILHCNPASLTVIELDPARAQFLRQRYARFVNVDVFCGDFMVAAPGDVFDRVVLNPPFNPDLDVQHVIHAYRSALRSGGILAAVITPRYQSDGSPLAELLRRLVRDHGSVTPLPDNEAEGATRETVLVRLMKP